MLWKKKENDSDAHARHFLRTTSQPLHARMQGASACLWLWGKTHRRCSDPNPPQICLCVHVRMGGRRPKGTCSHVPPPAGPCVWRVLEAPLLIRGVHVVRRSGAHACVPSPEGGTAHAPVNFPSYVYLPAYFWLLQQKIPGSGLIRTGGGLNWYARWYASKWAWVWSSWSTLVPYFRLFGCIIKAPKIDIHFMSHLSKIWRFNSVSHFITTKRTLTHFYKLLMTRTYIEGKKNSSTIFATNQTFV